MTLAVTMLAVRIPKLVALPEATFNVFRFEYPSTFAFPVKIMLDVLRELATAKLVKRPTEVMFGWSGFVTLAATLAAATLPTRFEELMLDNPDAFPVNKFEFRIPDTTRDVRVPTDVMLV